MIVEELVNLILFRLDGEDAAEKGATLLSSLKAGAVAAAGAAVAAAAGLTAIVVSAAAAAAPLAKTSDALGISVETLQEWGLAVNDAALALRAFSKTSTDFIRGAGEAKPYLEKMGIAARDFADLGLEGRLSLVADAFARLPAGPERTAAAMALFGETGTGLLPFLSRGSKGIADMRAEFAALGPALSRADLAKFEAFNDDLSRLQRAVRSVRDQIALRLVPAMTRIIDRALAWWKVNREVVQQRLDRVADRLARALEAAADALLSLVDGANAAIDALGGLDRAAAVLKATLILLASVALAALILQLNAVGALLPFLVGWFIRTGVVAVATAARAAAAWIAAAAPFVALGALIAGIILVIEDLIVYVQGGESAFGALLDRMREAGPVLKSLADLLDYVFGGGIGNDLYDMLEAVSGVLSEVMAGLKEGILAIPDALARAWAALKQGLSLIPSSLLEAGRQAVDLAGKASFTPARPETLVARAAAGVAAGASGNQTAATFNMGGNTFNLGSGGSSSVGDLNRALAQRDRAAADDYRRALQSLTTGEAY